MGEPVKGAQFYGTDWDRYVQLDAHKVEWPGDEWGSPEIWERFYRELFVNHGVSEWRRAVEIGQGSGKYTLKVLRNPEVHVRAYDVSEKFLAVAAERCADLIDAGRLDLRLIDTSVPSFLLDDLGSWKRQVDGFYSIDAMVHVDLQYLVAYLITAAAVLRRGGKLVLTVASATTDVGFEKLLLDIRRQWITVREKFEWLCGAMVEQLLPRLGFEVDLLWESPHGNSANVVASLARPEVGDELAGFLRYPT